MVAAARDLLGRTMSCRHIDDLVIVVHNKTCAPSDAEWESYLEWCKVLLQSHGLLKVLVIAGPHSPTASQRSRYNQEIGAESVRIGVLIPSAAMLAVVKVFSWFVKNIKAFDKDAVESALEYLGVAPSLEITDTIRQFGSGAGRAESA